MGGGELSAGSGGGGWWQDAEEAGERDMGSSSSSSTLDSSSEWLDSDRHYKRRKKKKKQQRSLVSRSACKNMNIGYKDKTPSAYLKIRAAQTGIVTVYKKGAQTSRYLSTVTEKQVMTSKGSSCIQVKNTHSDGFRSIFAVT